MFNSQQLLVQSWKLVLDSQTLPHVNLFQDRFGHIQPNGAVANLLPSRVYMSLLRFKKISSESSTSSFHTIPQQNFFWKLWCTTCSSHSTLIQQQLRPHDGLKPLDVHVLPFTGPMTSGNQKSRFRHAEHRFMMIQSPRMPIDPFPNWWPDFLLNQISIFHIQEDKIP